MVHRFPITLTQLTYFTECAKTLNMTAASNELHVAQSAVSTAITQLERSLGAILFIRHHAKGLTLTPAGESLLRNSHMLFGFLSDAIDEVRADQHEVRGSINLACFSTLAPFLIPQIITRLKERHPELTVTVIEGDHEENLSALRSGRAELAINYALTEAAGITQDAVGEVNPYIVLHAAHPLAKRKSVALAELADDPFVLLDLPGSSGYFLGILVQAGITPQLKYRSSNYETVRSLVATGLGYSILNQRPRTDSTYSGARTVAVEIKNPVPSLSIAVSALTQTHRSARAHAVATTVREVIAEPHRTEPHGTALHCTE